MTASAPGFVAPARRRVYLMRHGDVSYFEGHVPEARARDARLNRTGREQALAAARALAEIPLDRVVASGMPRSQETAQLVVAGRDLALECCEGLCEISPGHLRDIPLEQLPDVVTGAFSGIVDAQTRFLGGETFGSLWARVLNAWTELLADRGWRQMLIVAHGGVNRALLSHALGAELAAFGSLEQDPGCINVLDVEDSGRLLVRLMNYSPYNPLKRGLEMTTMERLYREYLETAQGRSFGPES